MLEIKEAFQFVLRIHLTPLTGFLVSFQSVSLKISSRDSPAKLRR
jgi:hypothetical protein